MRCSDCGSDNPPGPKFCMNCGGKLEMMGPAAASTIFCPQCGSQLSPGSQFCNNCGARLIIMCPRCGTDAAGGQRFCNTCGNDLSQGASVRVAGAAAAPRAGPRSRPGFSVRPSAVVAGIGAILMLISLAVPWYTIRNGASENISAGDLMDTVSAADKSEMAYYGISEPIWAGHGLSVILIIIAASLVLISVLISIFARVTAKPLWVLLGQLSVLCILGNAGYLIWYFHDTVWKLSYGSHSWWPNIAAAGSVLALIGAFLVLGGGMFSRSKR